MVMVVRVAGFLNHIGMIAKTEVGVNRPVSDVARIFNPHGTLADCKSKLGHWGSSELLSFPDENLDTPCIVGDLIPLILAAEK